MGATVVVPSPPVGHRTPAKAALCCALLAGASAAAPWLITRLPAPSGALGPAYRASLLCLVVGTLLVAATHTAVDARRTIVPAGILIGLLAGVLVTRPGHVSLTLGLGIVIAATCEEVIFRALLPNAMASALRRSQLSPRAAWVIATIGAQAAFALSHFAVMPFEVSEFFRLFAAGLMFAELALLGGIPLAALAHGVFNTWAVADGGIPPTLAVAVACMFLGVVLIGSRPTGAMLLRAAASSLSPTRGMLP